MLNLHPSQRGYFAGALFDAMEKNDSIYLITADLGYKVWDQHFAKFPDRCINTGASEQAALGIAVGLAQSGKKPFVYTITSFFLRAAETISLYLEHENANVCLVGAGRNDDYLTDGYTHFAHKAQEFITDMGIESFYPLEKEEVPEMVEQILKVNRPTFLSLKR